MKAFLFESVLSLSMIRLLEVTYWPSHDLCCNVAPILRLRLSKVKTMYASIDTVTFVHSLTVVV